MKKQIEEMARELCPFSQEFESCSKCNTELDIDGEPCIYMIMAKHITDNGYRKASDVVREVLKEVRELYITDDRYAALERRIKKKYGE